MQTKHPILALLVLTTLGLSACGPRDENSEGNGPGTADGAGARTDPPPQQQPTDEQQPQQ